MAVRPQQVSSALKLGPLAELLYKSTFQGLTPDQAAIESAGSSLGSYLGQTFTPQNRLASSLMTYGGAQWAPLLSNLLKGEGMKGLSPASGLGSLATAALPTQYGNFAPYFNVAGQAGYQTLSNALKGLPMLQGVGPNVTAALGKVGGGPASAIGSGLSSLGKTFSSQALQNMGKFVTSNIPILGPILGALQGGLTGQNKGFSTIQGLMGGVPVVGPLFAGLMSVAQASMKPSRHEAVYDSYMEQFRNIMNNRERNMTKQGVTPTGISISAPPTELYGGKKQKDRRQAITGYYQTELDKVFQNDPYIADKFRGPTQIQSYKGPIGKPTSPGSLYGGLLSRLNAGGYIPWITPDMERGNWSQGLYIPTSKELEAFINSENERLDPNSTQRVSDSQ